MKFDKFRFNLSSGIEKFAFVIKNSVLQMGALAGTN
jgi:hypothetical protein